MLLLILLSILSMVLQIYTTVERIRSDNILFKQFYKEVGIDLSIYGSGVDLIVNETLTYNYRYGAYGLELCLYHPEYTIYASKEILDDIAKQVEFNKSIRIKMID